MLWHAYFALPTQQVVQRVMNIWSVDLPVQKPVITTMKTSSVPLSVLLAASAPRELLIIMRCVYRQMSALMTAVSVLEGRSGRIVALPAL